MANIVSDCSKLPQVPRGVDLRRAGWTPILKKAADLAVVAGVDLKRCHGTHWAPKWFVTLLKEASRLAHDRGVTVEQFIRDLVREQIVNVVGSLLSKNEVEEDDVAFSIPRLLGKPVTFGDIRIYPDGRVEIAMVLSATEWTSIDEEWCRAFDAEARLTGATGEIYEAASILLDAYEKERDAQTRKTP